MEDDGLRAVLAEPFRSLLAPEIVGATVESDAGGPAEGVPLTDAIERVLASRQALSVRKIFNHEGLKQIDLVPRVGVEPTLRGF